MSRLRNIQGVTRVSLSKSEKADRWPPRPGQTVGPCGKGSPPSFELVVFFEKATVGAALADATRDRLGRARAADRCRRRRTAKSGDAAATPTPAATKEGATP